MRVSLVIDGNAAGAQKAAQDASAAVASVGKQAQAVGSAARDASSNVVDFGKRAEVAAKEVEEALKRAAGASGGNYLTAFSSELNKSVAAINDMSSVGQKRLDELRAKYNPLFAAQQQYRRELDDLRDAYRAGALGDAEYGKALTALKTSFADQVKTIQSGSKTIQSGAGLARHELINLSRQAQDIGVSLVSGQSPFTVLVQQGTQVADIFATSQGSVGGFARQVMGVLTPTRLLAGGVIGLAAGFVAATSSVVKSSLALDDLSRSTDLSVGKLHQLQQATSFKGIGADDFAKGIAGFADSVYQAQRNAGSLNGLMIANGKSAKDLEGYLSSVADLVARSSSDVQKMKILREAGLPSDAAWVRFMEQGSAGIRSAISGTVQFGELSEANLIRKAREFDDAWNTATTKLVNYFKSSVVEIASALAGIQVPDWLKKVLSAGGGALSGLPVVGPLIGAGRLAASAADYATSRPTNFADRFGNFERPLNAGPLQRGLNQAAGIREPTTGDEERLRNQQAMQRLSILSQLGRVEDQVAAKEREIQAARLNGIKISLSEADALIAVTRAQAEMTRVGQQASIGIYDQAKAQQAANDQLKALVAQGLLDPTNSEQMAAAQVALGKALRDTADAAKVAGSNLPGLQQAINDASNANKQIDQFATSQFSSVTTGLADIVDGTKQASQGALDLAKSFSRGLTEMAIKTQITMPIFQSLMGVLGGGSGGILSILGLGVPSLTASGAIAGAVGPTSVGGAPLTFDRGGYTGAGGKYQAAGVVHRDEYVFDQDSTRGLGVAFLDRLRRTAKGYAGGGRVGGSSASSDLPVWAPGDVTVNVNNVPAGTSVNALQAVDGRGNRRIELTLDDQVSAAMARPGSATQRALRNNYGAKPSGVRR